MSRSCFVIALWVFTSAAISTTRAGVGDPQLRTDHEWYPGELACSRFERLFETQALVYERVTGIRPQTDQELALASWLWRNTHYWHGEEGAEDLWDNNFAGGKDMRTREYWTGLFAHGFGLCGTTHSQWIAEFEARFGHNRARGMGVEGHNSFEVLLTGGPYGSGKWALLDHDISTVVFDAAGKSLLSIAEVRTDWKHLTDRQFAREKQNGWLVCGLHASDGSVYQRCETAEYLAGYSGPPPVVHLRRGETLRRYIEPGLEDGKTFAYWGLNSHTAGIPGPERSLTWVNQPERMFGSREGTGFHPGQARFGNAIYVYRPDFSGAYREGIIEESDRHVTFEFYTPFIIAAAPADDSDWGIYKSGCKNGLVVHGSAKCSVAISVDQGHSWRDGGILRDAIDLTDFVKGRRQYFIRFGVAARKLSGSGLTMTTVCQANPCIMPRMKDNGTRVEFAASGRGVVSAGPNRDQAQSHLIDGAFGTPRVTLEIKTPRGEPAVVVYAAAHVLSSNPPDPSVKYQIEYSNDSGRTWRSLVRDWSITRRGEEPADFWSQSLCWGSAELSGDQAVQVRYRNDGGKSYARCEAHLVYRVAGGDATRATFAWADDAGRHTESHVFDAGGDAKDRPAVWDLPTAAKTRTRWIELEPVSSDREAR